MKSIDADIVVIGAGVVGSAIARQCSLSFPDKKIIVIEKNTKSGMEASSHNSGMLHSGIHEGPSLLKSRLARRGNKLAAAYCAEKGLAIQKTGMIIAIPRNIRKRDMVEQLFRLIGLMFRAWRLRIPFKLLFPARAKQYESEIQIVAGIMTPNVYVIDPLQFTQALQSGAEAKGVEYYYDAAVTSITKQGEKYIITTSSDQFIAGTVINATGSSSDEIAALAGFDKYHVFPWRGEYYQLAGHKVSRPVSPVMPRHHGKGILISPHTDGSVFVGPNSFPVTDKHDYTSQQTDPAEFLKAAQSFLPNVALADLTWSHAGIRPKLNNDFHETDFIIQKDSSEPTFVNLVGIESPGLTASMAIGEFVADLITVKE